jgi:protein involved in polysaccharide export with SLBB domain
LEIGGLSYKEGVAVIENGVHEYYAKATVTVNLVSITSQKVYVVGEVTSPGVLQLTGDMPLFEAVTRAGGINTSAKTKNLLLIRQGEEGGELFMIDVGLLLSGDASQNIAMRAEDILVVPTKTIVQIERFFRQISTILGPFVNMTQVHRNLNMSANTVIEDTPVTTGQ